MVKRALPSAWRFVLLNLRYALKKKNDIIWEFFPNVGRPPPLLGTPYLKKYEICNMKYEI